MAVFKQQNLGYGTYYSDHPNGPRNKTTRFLVIGVIVAAVIGIGLFVANLLIGNSRNDLTLLAVRENSLLTLANASQKNIRSPELSLANSNATVLLTSDVVSMTSDLGMKKLPDDLVKKEADTNAENLKQASLLNKFDSTYRQIVLEKVSTLITQAQTVRDALGSGKSRDTVNKAIVNLQSIEKQFGDLDL